MALLDESILMALILISQNRASGVTFDEVDGYGHFRLLMDISAGRFLTGDPLNHAAARYIIEQICLCIQSSDGPNVGRR